MTNLSQTLPPSIHIDINTGDNLNISNITDLDCDEVICKKIINTTLAYTANEIVLPVKPISISLYFVENEEGRELNSDYRGKDYATNVLSFPSDMNDLPPEILADLDEYSLGELIICLPVVIKEAKEQQKTLQNHFTHLLVHGCLHLLGYDHELSENITQIDAQHMEALEISVLENLGIENPYNADEV